MKHRLLPHTRNLARRAIVAALVSSLGLALAVVGAGAQNAATTRIGAVRIEPSPYADQLAPVLLPALQKAFADRLVRGDRHAAVLLVRIDSLFFTSYVDTNDPRADVDWMTGAGRLLGPGNQLLGDYPLTINVPASYSGAWNLPDIDERRLDSLCQAFSQWLRKAM
jgi:hypothetical protein